MYPEIYCWATRIQLGIAAQSRIIIKFCSLHCINPRRSAVVVASVALTSMNFRCWQVKKSIAGEARAISGDGISAFSLRGRNSAGHSSFHHEWMCSTSAVSRVRTHSIPRIVDVSEKFWRDGRTATCAQIHG